MKNNEYYNKLLTLALLVMISISLGFVLRHIIRSQYPESPLSIPDYIFMFSPFVLIWNIFLLLRKEMRSHPFSGLFDSRIEFVVSHLGCALCLFIGVKAMLDSLVNWWILAVFMPIISLILIWYISKHIDGNIERSSSSVGEEESLRIGGKAE